MVTLSLYKLHWQCGKVILFDIVLQTYNNNKHINNADAFFVLQKTMENPQGNLFQDES